MRVPKRQLAWELQFLSSSLPKKCGRHAGCYSEIAMKAFREYSRLFVVYMSFAVFLAGEAAVIFLVYKHLGIL
ncbi:MAG: hypothetical protein ACXW3Z_08610 [Limisphaerales bacterium]